MYALPQIAKLLKLSLHDIPDVMIDTLLTDSRKLVHPDSSLFFALSGPRRDGHAFIPELYKKGVRYFVVSEPFSKKNFPKAVFLKVSNVLEALQTIAAYHRQQFQWEVIGVTGSNGKTIVKEWLYQLLQHHYNIVRSPKSYNSQIGVPLSVWQMEPHNNLAIFEAGISCRGEMERLYRIIRPTIGVLTNIGAAHSEGFESNAEKLEEKLELFKTAKIIIANADDRLIRDTIVKKQLPAFFWGKHRDSQLRIASIKNDKSDTTIRLRYEKQRFEITIPFTDNASIENALTACAVLLCLKIDIADIQSGMRHLQPVNMRLEFKKGINNCIIINDSYSADTDSLSIALDFLQQQSRGFNKTAILSDFLQTGKNVEEVYCTILSQIEKHKIKRLIGIGPQMQTWLPRLIGEKKSSLTDFSTYASTKEFLRHIHTLHFKDEAILVKGARIFEFEEIVAQLEQKLHQTILEINLNAIAHNFRIYQEILKPTTKMMVMVKAFAYGSGGTEIASLLQYHKADYLGVAYADEGVELRKADITLPIMVLNPEESAFDSITEYNLEPDIFSFTMLEAFERHVQKIGVKNYPIHIEVETGMNRLGFDTADVPLLAQRLKNNPYLHIQSVFSHLAASEDKVEDAFTLQQYEKLMTASETIKEWVGYSFLRHIANSSAIARFPKLQLDMVRLGIGLYGIGDKRIRKKLQPALTLRSTIAQVKRLKKGDTVSYNRRGVIKKDTVIATVRIGYADGYYRSLGNGVGYMLVKNKKAPVVGTVCMDMVMIDITHIKGVKEGDDVIVFGNGLPLEELAERMDTIPYEIMTGISQRVKRVYWSE